MSATGCLTELLFPFKLSKGVVRKRVKEAVVICRYREKEAVLGWNREIESGIRIIVCLLIWK